MRNILIVAFGGMIGTVARYVLYVNYPFQHFPYTTLIINIAGSLIIGAIAGYAIKQISFEDWRLFLATGVCGGFTTFSAFSLECVQLLQQSRNIAACVYILSSIVFGIAAAFAGYYFTK